MVSRTFILSPDGTWYPQLPDQPPCLLGISLYHLGGNVEPVSCSRGSVAFCEIRLTLKKNLMLESFLDLAHLSQSGILI